MFTRLLVLDPGRTTGYAMFSKDGESLWVLDQWGAFSTWKEISNFVKISDIVLMEKVCAKSAKFDDIAIGVMYVTEYICEQQKKPVHTQTPQFMKAVYLYAADFLEGMNPIHARDAIAHGIAFLEFKNIDKTRMRNSYPDKYQTNITFR
jgi:hypothetical protein